MINIKTIIIDDEPLARQLLKDYLNDQPHIQVIAECSDGFEAIKAIRKEKPDLIFLDIQMPRINGFELLELLDDPPAVIFITAYDEYALRAFEASALDYLLKPFPKKRLLKSIEKFKSGLDPKSSPEELENLISKVNENRELNRVVVKNGAEIKIIPVHDIFFLEAYDDYVKIHTRNGMFLKKQTLQQFDQHLDPTRFVRVHRSFILQLSELTRIEPAGKEQHQAILKNNARIPLSRSGYSRLKSALGI
jgi:two-component system, LytTR family, response regulator